MHKIMLFSVILSAAVGASLLGQESSPEPMTARDFYQRGQRREDAKNLAGALADYKKAGELKPEWFDTHFSRSSVCAELKDYRGAIQALADALKARPKDYSALFNSGLYHEYLKEYDAAIASYSQALADDVDVSFWVDSRSEAQAHAYHYRGRVYQWYKGDAEKAAADFTEALRLDPKIEMVTYRRARAYHDLKEYAKAHADFDVANKLDPNYPNLLNAWAWQLATCPEAKHRNGKMALQFAKQTKDSETLAAAYAELGDFKQAVTAQQQAIKRLEQRPKPKNKGAAERRKKLREAMAKRLATYTEGRPFRDE